MVVKNSYEITNCVMIDYAVSCAKMLKEDIGVADVCVCGSAALEALGLHLNRKIHDIDIKVFVRDDDKDNNDIIEKLNLLESASVDAPALAAYDNCLRNKDEDGFKKMYIFNFGKTPVNVFIEKGKFNPFAGHQLTYKGVKFSPIDKTLEMKKSFGRIKDSEDINYFVYQLTKPAENEKENDDDLPF